MEEPTNTPRPARRTKEAKLSTTTAVALEPDAYSMLTKAAKKLNAKYSVFASAAIRYFAANGLDPTSQETMGLISVQAKVGEASLEIRKSVVETSNQTVRTIHAVEHELSKFLQTQQAGTFAYLERIEATLLQSQLEMEFRLLEQILEKIVGIEVEDQVNRELLKKLLLKSKEQEFSEAELDLVMQDFASKRKQLLLTEYRKLLSTLTPEKSQPATRPALAPISVSTPMKAGSFVFSTPPVLPS